MKYAPPVKELPVPAHDQQSLHPWIRALATFHVSFICYDVDGRRRFVSPSAAEMVQVEHGDMLLNQADRVAGELVGRVSPSRRDDQFSLVREAPCYATGTLLAVYVAQTLIGGTGAVVVLRDQARAISTGETCAGLSARETDVARLIGCGLATKEIASRLGISVHTARHHTERVFSKLGIRTRASVAALFAQSRPINS